MNGRGVNRIRVDLADHFKDYRKDSIIFIKQPSIKTIQDLKNHICQLFDLIDDFEVFVGVIHVPNLESVNIFEGDDIIRIRRVANKSKRKRSENEKSQEISPRNEEKKNGENTLEMYSVGNEKQIVVDDEDEPELKKKRKSREKKKCQLSLGSSIDFTTESSDANYSSLGSVNKRKKKHKDGPKSELTENTIQTSTPVSKDSDVCSDDKRSIQDEPCTKAKDVPVDGPSYENVTDNNFTMGEFPLSGKTESMLTLSEDMSKFSPTNQNIEGEMLDSGIKLDAVKRRRKRPRRKKQRVGTAALPPKPSQPPKQMIKAPNQQYEKSFVFKSAQNNKHLRFSDEEDQMMAGECSMELDAPDDSTLSRRPSSAQKNSKSIVENVTEENYGSIGIVESEGSSAAEVEVVEERGQMLHVKEESPKEIPSSADATMECSLNNDLQVKNIDPPADNVMQPKSDGGFVGSNACSRANRRRNVIIAKSIGSTLLHLMGETNKSEGTKKNNQEIEPTAVIKPPQNFPKSEPVSEPQVNKKDRRYKGFPVLESIPRKGDILAFKILKLNESYEPSISDYMEGKVIGLDLEKSGVSVRVLSGANELKKTSGKFDLEEEESTTQMNDESEVDIELPWSEFIEPRIVFP